MIASRYPCLGCSTNKTALISPSQTSMSSVWLCCASDGLILVRFSSVTEVFLLKLGKRKKCLLSLLPVKNVLEVLCRTIKHEKETKNLRTEKKKTNKKNKKIKTIRTNENFRKVPRYKINVQNSTEFFCQ